MAAARGMSAGDLRQLVASHTGGRQVGILGEPRVNVLQLNLALDQAAPIPAGRRKRSFRSNPVDPLKTRPAVEITIEAQNRSNAMALHNRNVHGIAGRQERPILNYLSSTQNLRFLDGDHFVDDVQCYLERRSDGLALFDSRIPMENLLQYFSVSYEALPRCNQALQDDLCVGLVRVRRSD